MNEKETKEVNSRIIKFRAWDKEKKLMIEGITLSDKTDAVLDVFEIMQFTGLKDKNGKEIYEGDIVMHPESVMSDMGEDKPNYLEKRIDSNFKYAGGSIGERRFGKEIKTVKWDNENCGFYPFSDSQNNCGHCGGGDIAKLVEVIGNVYENKKLLGN